MKKILFLIFIVCVFVLPVISTAESELFISSDDISVDMYPENPEPYEDVKITLTSYATDLNKSLIEWRSGNKIILSGYGKTSYSFRTQGPNTSTSFTIVVVPSTGDRITKTITVNPSEVELLWESVDGYTPPFYKGKALASRESTIKVIAVPNTSTITSGKGDIVYKWKRNDETSLSNSGYNKDSFVFINSKLKESENIAVTASSVDSVYNAVKNIEIPTYSPKILFYKRSPTEGILYNSILNSSTLFSDEEMTIVAEPYFLAIKGSEGLFTYKWRINDESINTPTKRTELTIRPTSKGGYANISVVFENINKLFQKVTGVLKLTL